MSLATLVCMALVQAPTPAAGDLNPEFVKLRPAQGKLTVGQRAPDFNLKRTRSEQRVRLSQFRNRKPVALVFGSYT